MVCLDSFTQLYSHQPHGSSIDSNPTPHLICTTCLTRLHNSGYTMCPLKCGASINIDGAPIIRRPLLRRQFVEDNPNRGEVAVARIEEPDILRSLFDGLNYIAPSTGRYTEPLLRAREVVIENDRQIGIAVLGGLETVANRVIHHVTTSELTPTLLLICLIYMINSYITR